MSEPGPSQDLANDGELLKKLFDDAMKILEAVESSKEATNSDQVQMSIKNAISKLEKATNLVSMSGMFSSNEALEELPTETLQYLLLPALLGTLNLKLCGSSRVDIIRVAEIYFRDFLQRCKDYDITNVEIPQPSTETNASRPQTEQAKIASMVMTREAKIRHYKETEALKAKLSNLSKDMASMYVDDATKREYFTTVILSYVNQALDELSSIEQEKPILEYLANHAAEPKPKQPRAPPLRPVTITRDMVRSAVLGAGYPARPHLTVEEFYEQRVRDGIFPSHNNIPHRTIQTTEAEADDAENERKERLVETDDPEELQRQRNMDDYKDDHRRGWGNRHNRS